MDERPLADLITSLRELTDEELMAHGFAVEGTFDEIDDPVLIGPDGVPVETWREGYPYERRITRDDPYFNIISDGWGEALKKAFHSLPAYSFGDT